MKQISKALAFGLSAMLLSSLFAISGCSSASPEVKAAGEQIASTDGQEVREGWIYLAQHQDEQGAADLIESLGGIPAPFDNMYELYRMSDSPYFDDSYLVEALGLERASATPGAAFSSDSEYIGPYAEDLFGSANVEVIAQVSSHYPTDAHYAELIVREIPLLASDDEVYEMIGRVASQLDLGEPVETGCVSASASDSNEKGRLWYAYGATSSSSDVSWFACYTVEDLLQADGGYKTYSILDVYVSDGFAANACKAMGTYRIDDWFVSDVLFEGSPDSDELTAQEQSSSSNDAIETDREDELVTDTDGKQVWKVRATSPTMHFAGSYEGQGNFFVKVLDGNQDLEELVCNEIGDHVLDKRVSVDLGETYYVQVEWSRGSWTMEWTGTGGK